MDIYEVPLLNVLIPDGVPDSWRKSDQFSPYIQHLSSCGISKLKSESENLKEEQATILDQAKELAYKEYHTFIHASDCSKSMGSQVAALETDLARTCEGVNSLQSTLDRFVTTSRSLLVSRQLNSVTLSKHTQLLEILELSQLLDTCVRNGYHDEALEIIAYVRRLEKRHGHIPIIRNIVLEVQASSQQMLTQLLLQLRSDINLPQCLKVVGMIRTLDVFTESQLRMKFLHERDAWLTSALAAIPKHDTYHQLSKSIECTRVHLFDIVTQYRAIFSDDELRVPALHDKNTDLPALFQSWLLHKVSTVLFALKCGLRRGGVTGNNLESLLSQCIFFGQSLSRIGADFRSLIPDIFLNAASRQLERDIRTANHKFDESLSSFSLLDTTFVLSSSATLPQQMASSPGKPSMTLIEFPPLGHYLNSLVATFNVIRQCCFPALLPKLVSLLTASLQKVVQSLLEMYQAENSGFSKSEEENFAKMCAALKYSLLPHLNTACLRALFPLPVLAQFTGCSALMLAKSSFGQLDVKKICAPLDQFVPRINTSDRISNTPEDQMDQIALVSTTKFEPNELVKTECADDTLMQDTGICNISTSNHDLDNKIEEPQEASHIFEVSESCSAVSTSAETSSLSPIATVSSSLRHTEIMKLPVIEENLTEIRLDD